MNEQQSQNLLLKVDPLSIRKNKLNTQVVDVIVTRNRELSGELDEHFQDPWNLDVAIKFAKQKQESVS